MAIIDLKNKKIVSLVKDIKAKCKKNGITFKLVKSSTIQSNGSFITGYFDSNNLELYVAEKSSIALEVLIHESCHLDQWVSKSPAITGTDFPHIKGTVVESHYLADLWMCEIIDIRNKKLINKMFERMMDCERDCEKRSIKKIKKYRLQNLIDLDEYRQKANAYILGYKTIIDHRCWFGKNKSPYSVKEVWSAFPKNKIVNTYKMTKKQKDLVNQLCFD